MAFKLFNDRLGSISHSAGTISLGASLITIGGQQYNATLSRVISSDVTLVANTLYMVYAQIVSGVVSMRVSASPRSVYLAANPLSELVGAFYANGLAAVAFGSFVNIVGSPNTDWTAYTPTVSPISGYTAGPTGFWRRVGSDAENNSNFRKNGVAGAGATAVTFSVPTGFVLDFSRFDINNGAANFGVAEFFTTVFNDTTPVVHSGGNTSVAFGRSGAGNLLLGTDIGANTYLSFQMSCPIVGWSNTQLMDL